MFRMDGEYASRYWLAEDVAEANPKVRFNNMVSATWRRRAGQGACMLDKVCVVSD